jgi:hypothetical protein
MFTDRNCFGPGLDSPELVSERQVPESITNDSLSHLEVLTNLETRECHLVMQRSLAGGSKLLVYDLLNSLPTTT